MLPARAIQAGDHKRGQEGTLGSRGEPECHRQGTVRHWSSIRAAHGPAIARAIYFKRRVATCIDPGPYPCHGWPRNGSSADDDSCRSSCCALSLIAIQAFWLRGHTLRTHASSPRCPS